MLERDTDIQKIKFWSNFHIINIQWWSNFSHNIQWWSNVSHNIQWWSHFSHNIQLWLNFSHNIQLMLCFFNIIPNADETCYMILHKIHIQIPLLLLSVKAVLQMLLGSPCSILWPFISFGCRRTGYQLSADACRQTVFCQVFLGLSASSHHIPNCIYT